MMIIGVSGKKQGGKTTMVNTLRQLLPNSVILRFADFLKQIVLMCFIPSEWNWTIEDLDLEENKNRPTPCGRTVRQLLQIIGTDWFRNLYDNCWITAWKKMVLNTQGAEYVLVPDVRFPNELEAIQQMGGKVIRLTRAPFRDQDQHVSEIALDEVEYDTKNVFGTDLLKFDYICDNVGMTMDEQARWTEEWVELVLGKKVM